MITLDQHIAKTRERLQQILANEKPLFLASQSALAEFSERVFDRGESASGGKFQYNSTTPLYVDPSKTFGNTSALKPPKGKTGKTKFKNGEPHKTTYVSSYKALRELVGREAGFVNWEATGDLKSEIENKTSPATPRKVSGGYEISVPTGENAEKLRGLNKKYPNVFKFNENEKKTFFNSFDFELKKLLREGFGNV